jgi:hypothetical protein
VNCCYCTVGSGLEPLDSHSSINSATGLRAATSADMGDSSNVAAAIRKAAGPSSTDAQLLTTASRLAVWLMVSEHMLWQRQDACNPRTCFLTCQHTQSTWAQGLCACCMFGLHLFDRPMHHASYTDILQVTHMHRCLIHACVSCAAHAASVLAGSARLQPVGPQTKCTHTCAEVYLELPLKMLCVLRNLYLSCAGPAGLAPASIPHLQRCSTADCAWCFDAARAAADHAPKHTWLGTCGVLDGRRQAGSWHCCQLNRLIILPRWVHSAKRHGVCAGHTHTVLLHVLWDGDNFSFQAPAGCRHEKSALPEHVQRSLLLWL